MLRQFIFAVSFACPVLVTVSCKPSTRNMLVGAWEVQGHGKTTIWMYKADHTLTCTGSNIEGVPIVAMGTWRLDHNQLTENLSASTANPALDITTVIEKLTSDELDLHMPGGTIVVMKRVR